MRFSCIDEMSGFFFFFNLLLRFLYVNDVSVCTSSVGINVYISVQIRGLLAYVAAFSSPKVDFYMYFDVSLMAAVCYYLVLVFFLIF